MKNQLEKYRCAMIASIAVILVMGCYLLVADPSVPSLVMFIVCLSISCVGYAIYAAHTDILAGINSMTEEQKSEIDLVPVSHIAGAIFLLIGLGTFFIYHGVSRMFGVTCGIVSSVCVFVFLLILFVIKANPEKHRLSK